MAERMETQLTGKKDILIQTLKARYKVDYDKIQPIPYIKEKLYCIDRVFVEGGLVCMTVGGASRGDGSWDRLKSYKDIFTDSRIKSERRILEGEPGYGKSTLTHQLAYDWCTGVKDSPVSDAEILILLRLRQLGGVRSIYRAIHLFLLAGEHQLSEDDVARIIQESRSVVVILDGYDEYPDKDITSRTDIHSIIMMNIFQDKHVLVTTRYLPQKFSSNTKRIKLTGFDDAARDEYIRKAVVGDHDIQGLNWIKQRLRDNAILADLCQVPLIFVMFAHMAHDNKKQFQNFDSVTSFFGYMISCFHSHLRNKLRDKNVNKHVYFENEHAKLDEIAYSGLSNENQQLTWSKVELCKFLGLDFYTLYTAIGILVEEEVIVNLHDAHRSSRGPTAIEVRFYHKLFCEWYAAHHLASVISERGRNVLSNLDPFDLQYVYRFACGINPAAGQYIIDHLKSRVEGGDKFAILCLLELKDQTDDVIRNVRDICSRDVEIKQNDTKLLQRSTMQLLEIASKNNISTSCLQLNKCVDKAGLASGDIMLKSRISLQPLSFLEKIELVGDSEDLTAGELTALLEYAAKCERLREMILDEYALPLSISQDSIPTNLISRDVKVSYALFGYQLDLKTAVWFDDIKAMGEACSKYVDIKQSHSLLRQQSAVLFLERAQQHQIPVSCLNLEESFQSADTSTGTITLNSGVVLSSLQSVRKIEIWPEYGREMTMDETLGICTYAQQSEILEKLEFAYCLLPQILPPGSIPEDWRTRKVKVMWTPRLLRQEYTYNLHSLSWVDWRGRELTDRMYEEEVQKFRDYWSHKEWQKKRRAAAGGN